MKLDFRALARSSAEGPSIVVLIGTSRVLWSIAQKIKKIEEVSVCVQRHNHSSSTNPRVLRSLLPRPDVATVFALRCFVVVDVHVQLLDGQAAARGKRRKAVIHDTSSVDHWGVTNLRAPIWFTGWAAALHRFSSRDYRCWFCVGKALWRWFYPRSMKRDHFQTLATGLPKLKTWLGTQRIKAGPPLDLSFWSFLTFLHHGIEESERHLLWKFHKKVQRKSWSNVPPKLLACIGFLYKVVHKNGRLRKFNHSREIELNFFTA